MCNFALWRGHVNGVVNLVCCQGTVKKDDGDKNEGKDEDDYEWNRQDAEGEGDKREMMMNMMKGINRLWWW